MKAAQNFEIYLRDMLAEIVLARQFVAGIQFEVFKANPEKVRAVIRSLEVIGEATRGIPSAIRIKYPGVPWRDMAGMRDRLIHGYGEVNLWQVWETVQKDLPGLKANIEAILAQEIGNNQEE